jgi:hypothetical protein
VTDYSANATLAAELMRLAERVCFQRPKWPHRARPTREIDSGASTPGLASLTRAGDWPRHWLDRLMQSNHRQSPGAGGGERGYVFWCGLRASSISPLRCALPPLGRPPTMRSAQHINRVLHSRDRS